MKEKSKEDAKKNVDPLTGAPGSHPVETGVGAAGGGVAGAAIGAAIGGPVGAAAGAVVGGIAAAYGAHGVAEAMNPTTEEKYWRKHHGKQPYAKKSLSYEDYAAGKAYEEIEDDLALDYERHEAGAALPWDHARHAVHAAGAKLSHDIGPRDPDRGIRSGF
jgi:uncharacterized protein YcfJ